MAMSLHVNKKTRRANTVVLSPALREKLAEWVNERSQKNLAEELKCTPRWLWKLRNLHEPLEKSLIIELCKMAGISFGPQLTDQDNFEWVAAEVAHMKWATSMMPSSDEGRVSLETKLKWRRWNKNGFWAVIHQGQICGTCECLSVTAEVMDWLLSGELTENQLGEREFFEYPAGSPTKQLLIRQLMMLDLETNRLESSPLAFFSVLAHLPSLIEGCVGPYLAEANVYASPLHAYELDKRVPFISERLMLKLGFVPVKSKARLPQAYFVINAGVLVETLKQMREIIRKH